MLINITTRSHKILMQELQEQCILLALEEVRAVRHFGNIWNIKYLVTFQQLLL